MDGDARPDKNSATRTSHPAALSAALSNPNESTHMNQPFHAAPTRIGDDAPASTSLPIIACPECSALEAGGYLGNRSASVVKFNEEHFTDNAGFLYCRECGAVWRTVYALPEDHGLDARNPPPRLFATHALGVAPTFNARESTDFRFFRRLAKTHARYASGQSKRTVRRASDRVYDAEALCALLDLPSGVKAAVTHHIAFLTAHADMRAISNATHEDGKVRAVRAEAVTTATVSLVMERFGVSRPGGLDRMLAAFRFTKGPPVIMPEEYRAAYHALANWFGSRLWRDGPQDNPSRTQEKTS
jgi:uncharacterized protein YbaR (Trm112 family)